MSKYLQVQMISMLQRMQCNDGLQRGSMTIVARRFNMAHSTVYQLWEQAAHMHAMGDIISPEIDSQKKMWEACYILTEVVQEGVKDLQLRKRHTKRKLAMSMGVLKTTVHCWIVGSTIHVHCNSLKPVLTEENKVARLLMALHFRDPVDLTKYHDMFDHPEEGEVSPSPGGEKPKCCIKHKSHITKVMLLCAVVCPRFYPSANSWWDRKLAI